MICLLCLTEREKLANAHITPKALYGETLTKEADTLLVPSSKTARRMRSPVGEYDTHILCEDCEKRFSSLDEHAAQLFIEETPRAIYHNNEPLIFAYETVDSTTVIMFFQFLKWRIGASSRSVFRAISLGPYREKLRLAVLNEEPSMCPELDVVISRFDRRRHAILLPSNLGIEGVNGYRIVFAGHTCWVKLDKRPFPDSFRAISLLSGTAVHAMHQEFQGSPEFRALRILAGDDRLKQQNWKGWVAKNQ